jgi:hypothetical protein
MTRLHFFMLALSLSAGCSAPVADDMDMTCTGDKCDLPDDPAEVSCTLRRGEAMSPNQHGFTETALRWSCNDARGVTAEDRGQEYCEYFAVVNAPGESTPKVVGRNLGDDSSKGTTPLAVTLSAAQITTLEKDGAAVVGQCVFTSWNSDVETAVTGGLKVAGVPVTATDFRMKFYVNSAEAADVLVEDCFVAKAGGERDLFTRACFHNEDLNGTSFRKSDTTVCAASMRMAECGCKVKNGGELGAALSPASRRGFPLGAWSSATSLPPSCRYVDPGDGSRTLVTCDLTAADLLASRSDPKARCRDKYSDNVVVHVPVPTDAVTCTPPAGGPHAEACPAKPWVL